MTRDVAVLKRPDQEGANGLPLVSEVAGVVDVDVGLCKGGWPHTQVRLAAGPRPCSLTSPGPGSTC